ncbi:hypothetical protein EVAR_34033_1 [Eumeta japonica]|uniref:Uncharacterized protein n=1 Tax=Eumeta variegata TaxID=151549 RepID=A0A4C1VSV6_EUMVA|nr:hypothetical protein EVAR_34033_1 [Eumeta japonica]
MPTVLELKGGPASLEGGWDRNRRAKTELKLRSKMGLVFTTGSGSEEFGSKIETDHRIGIKIVIEREGLLDITVLFILQLNADDRHVPQTLSPRFCYHQFSEIPPTVEANLKTYSRQKETRETRHNLTWLTAARAGVDSRFAENESALLHEKFLKTRPCAGIITAHRRPVTSVIERWVASCDVSTQKSFDAKWTFFSWLRVQFSVTCTLPENYLSCKKIQEVVWNSHVTVPAVRISATCPGNEIMTLRYDDDENDEIMTSFAVRCRSGDVPRESREPELNLQTLDC